MLNIAAVNPATTSTKTATPLSPREAGEILKCDNVNAITLYTIAKGLVTTIKNHKTLHQAIVSALEDYIKSLEERVGYYTDTFDKCLEDYEENIHYPRLSIPIGNSLCREVKWVKRVDPQTISCYTAEDRPSSTPHILKIYAQLVLTTDPGNLYQPGSTTPSLGPPQPSIPSARPHKTSTTGASRQILTATAISRMPSASPWLRPRNTRPTLIGITSLKDYARPGWKQHMLLPVLHIWKGLCQPSCVVHMGAEVSKLLGGADGSVPGTTGTW